MDSTSDAAMVTLMEIINKIEFLNQQLEKEEKLRKEQLEREEKLRIKQLEKEEKLRLEKIEQEQRQSDRDLALKRFEMEQEIEKIKLSQAEKLEFERLRCERTKIEAEKELKAHDIEIQAKATSTSHTKQSNMPSIKLPDSFDAPIHKNPSLQDVDKLNYLKGLLKNKAKDVIFGLEITGNN